MLFVMFDNIIPYIYTVHEYRLLRDRYHDNIHVHVHVHVHTLICTGTCSMHIQNAVIHMCIHK